MLCEADWFTHINVFYPMRHDPKVKPLVENLYFNKFVFWEILKNYHNKLSVCKVPLQFSYTAVVKFKTGFDNFLLHISFFFFQKTFNRSELYKQIIQFIGMVFYIKFV